MKLLFLTGVLTFFFQNVSGQISGKLTTSDAQPIPFASVLLLNVSDSSLVKGELTNESGEYRVDGIGPGQYFLRISAVGFIAINSVPLLVTAGQTNKDLGIQILQEETQELKEVVIFGEKPLYQQEIDRTVINVESSVLTKGSSVLQILERSPGVSLDPRNNSITLNGKSSVMVMLNGKLMRLPMAQLVSMLAGMSGNDIEKIELLTTPPAKYDAEGNAGMINIVLKNSDEPGTNGSFSATTGYGWREKGAASVNVAHSTGRVRVFGSYSFLRDRNRGGWTATGTQNMPAMGGKLSTNVWNNEKAVANSHNASLGVDLHIGKAITIGTNVTYNTSRVTRSIFNLAEYTIVESDSLMVMHSHMTGESRWNNMIGNIYFEKKISDEEKLNIDLDYIGFGNESPTEGNTTFFDRSGREALPEGSIFSNRQKGLASSPVQVGVLKMDYAKRLSKRVRLEAGVKSTVTKSSGSSSVSQLMNGEWVSGSRTSNNIDVKEWIGAAYSSFTVQIDPQLSLVAGVRYEYSHQRMEADKKENQIDRKLSKLFPAIFAEKKLTDRSAVQLSYTKRISRPSYNDLASYLLYNDPMSVMAGNPTLRATITNNVKLGYTYNGYSFSVLASRDDYPIVRYQLAENAESDLMYVAPQNMAYQNSLTFQTNLPFKITRWWNMSYGFVGGLRQFKLSHTKDPFWQTYLASAVNSSHTIELPNSFSLEISGWYNSFQFDGSKKLDGFGTLNAGIKKELNKDRGSIQLTVTDLLKSIHYTSTYGSLTEEAFSIKSHVVYKPESAHNRIVKLTYTRSFGNSRMKDRKSRNAVSDDERNRIRRE
jgi:iron complex outermembrane receptor protein